MPDCFRFSENWGTPAPNFSLAGGLEPHYSGELIVDGKMGQYLGYPKPLSF